MDFYSKTIDGRQMTYYDSGTDSAIQLIFAPGVTNPEIWKHQTKYFSKNFRVLTYRNKGDSYEEEVQNLDKVLSLNGIDNAVLIGANLSNSVIQEFEGRENVVATIMTGANPDYGFKLPSEVFKAMWLFGFKKPKITKKLFFSERTTHRIANRFLQDLEQPSYPSFNSYVRQYQIRRPVKNSLIIHGEDDNLSSKKFAKSMQPNVKISTINCAGTFSFYEKPEAYNKAVLDFLKNLEGFVESRNIGQKKKSHRSLREFEKTRDAIKKTKTESREKNEKENERPIAKWQQA